MATSLPNPADSVAAPPAEPQQPAEPQAPALFERVDAGDGKHTVRLNTGEVFTGTPDELVEKLAGSAAHTHNYGRQLKTKLAAFEQQQPPQQPVVPQVPAVDPAEQMIADIAAKALGFQNAAHQRQEYERINASQAEIQGRMVANQFMAENPDFGPSDHNSRVLTQILADNNMPETPMTLAMAHNWAKAQNPPLYEQVTPQPRGQQWNRPQPPPALPQGASSAGASAISEVDLYSMPMDKLAEVYQRTRQ